MGLSGKLFLKSCIIPPGRQSDKNFKSRRKNSFDNGLIAEFRRQIATHGGAVLYILKFVGG
jgi:hypothetical protein